MQFDRVADEARRQNAWEVKAIFEIAATEGTYPGGVVMFRRPALDNEQNRKIHGVDICYGTASFVIAERGRIVFGTGHYDMAEGESINDFATRCEKGR